MNQNLHIFIQKLCKNKQKYLEVSSFFLDLQL